MAYLGLRKLFAPSIRPPRITAGRGAGIPVGWSPFPLAAQLHTEMEGVNWGGFDHKSWITLSELPTDDMVVAVYKAFNQQYFNEGAGTLTKWIMDEAGQTYRQVALNRLRSLQLPYKEKGTILLEAPFIKCLTFRCRTLLWTINRLTALQI